MQKHSIAQPFICTPSKSPKRVKKLAPMPAIIRPVLPPIHNRRLIDSALGARPNTSGSSGSDEGQVEVTHLPLHSVDSMKRFEDALIDEPATSRSSAILDMIPLLNGEHKEEILDQIILRFPNQNDESFSTIDFRVYHILTQTLFTLIRDYYQSGKNDNLFFKSLALAFRIMPPADREMLSIVAKLLYRMSRIADFDLNFLKCQLIKKLIETAFTQYGELSMYSAAILKNIAHIKENADEIMKHDILKLICKTLNTRIRRERFQSELSLYTYQIISLFASLYEFITDFSEIAKYSLPLYLLDIVTIYMDDTGILAAVSKAITLMMSNVECVEVLEGEDLMPFFIMLQSPTPKIVSNTALALANSMNLSDLIVDGVCDVSMPFGVAQLCELLKGSMESGNQMLTLSLSRCLAKASTVKSGVDTILLYLHNFVPLLRTELDELETWTDEEMIVASTLIIMKNAAIVDLMKKGENSGKLVPSLLKGMMNDLMYYGIIDYVIDLMKVLMKSEEGKEVCREVSEMEEIKMVLGEI